MNTTTDVGQVAVYVVLALLVLFVVIALVRSVRIVPQAVAILVERLGRYSRTLDAGLHLLIPFVDRVRAGVDLREQVVSFPPQPVITSDNLVVSIDTVISPSTAGSTLICRFEARRSTGVASHSRSRNAGVRRNNGTCCSR